MQTDVRTVGMDSPVSEVLVSLADGHVTGLPVVDRTGRVVGVVSSTDVIAARAESGSAVERKNLETTPVREIMTPRPLMIPPSAEVHEAAQHMLYAEIRRVFVEENGKLVGVISQSDIVQAVETGKLARSGGGHADSTRAGSSRSASAFRGALDRG